MEKSLRELLLKDLCARLPYGVVVQEPDYYEAPLTIATMSEVFYNDLEIKPYLRPMSSMTEEEFKEVTEIDRKRMIFSARHLTWHIDGEVIDYFNRKMLDWRGLIPMGLALEAPEDMYK